MAVVGTTAAGRAAQPPGTLTYVAAVPSLQAFIAVAVEGNGILAYVTDGGQTAEWFSGRTTDGVFTLVSASNRAGLSGLVSPLGLAGTLRTADGQDHPFIALPAGARGPGGLYRLTTSTDGRVLLGGWVVLAGGETRGSVQLNGAVLPAPPIALAGVITAAPGQGNHLRLARTLAARLSDGTVLIAPRITAFAGSGAALPVPPPPSAPRTPGDCTVSDADLALDQPEQDLLAALNALRARQGAPPFDLDVALTRAAVWKSSLRARGAVETHDDLDRAWTDRLTDCGVDVTAVTVAEGLVRIETPAADAEVTLLLDTLRGTPEGEATLADPALQLVGVARVLLPGSGRAYWTVDFAGLAGRARARPAAAPPP
jgi:uncharacterized protein YkwD